MPDMYAHLDVGERDLDHPMPWTEITRPLSTPSLPNPGQLNAASQKRQSADTIFQLEEENALRLKYSQQDGLSRQYSKSPIVSPVPVVQLRMPC